MNRKQLTYFLTVCRTQNIQAAANELFISHQGLSRVLKTLEEELGQPLFLRSNRGLELTDFAGALIPHVRQLLEDFERIEGVRTLAAQNKAVVTIYSLDHLLHFLGADFAEAFCTAHPEITLSVVDTTDARLGGAGARRLRLRARERAAGQHALRGRRTVSLPLLLSHARGPSAGKKRAPDHGGFPRSEADRQGAGI